MMLSQCTLLKFPPSLFEGNIGFFINWQIVFRHVRKISISNCYLCHVACPPFLLSSWNSSPPTGWNFMKFVEKIQVLLKCAKNNGTLHEDSMYAYNISLIILRMKNVTNCRSTVSVQYDNWAWKGSPIHLELCR